MNKARLSFTGKQEIPTWVSRTILTFVHNSLSQRRNQAGSASLLPKEHNRHTIGSWEFVETPFNTQGLAEPHSGIKRGVLCVVRNLSLKLPAVDLQGGKGLARHSRAILGVGPSLLAHCTHTQNAANKRCVLWAVDWHWMALHRLAKLVVY